MGLAWDSWFSLRKQAFYAFKFFNGLLPLSRCIVPALRMANSEVDFGRCFLKYPYEKTIQLINPDDLPGCYEVLPQVSYRILFSVLIFQQLDSLNEKEISFLGAVFLNTRPCMILTFKPRDNLGMGL